MNVRSSTRATSSGSERARYEFGRLASDRRSKVPLSTSTWHSSSYSSADPSHQWTWSGLHIAAISSTHARSRSCFVGTVMSLAILWCQLLRVRRNDGGSPPRCGCSLYVPARGLCHARDRSGRLRNAAATSIAPARRAAEAGPRSVGRRSGAAAGQLEPDAGLVVVAMDAPPVRHL